MPGQPGSAGGNEPQEPVAGVGEFGRRPSEPVAMGEFEPSPERAAAIASANLRTVLRSMPVLRLISCCETPFSSSVITVPF